MATKTAARRALNSLRMRKLIPASMPLQHCALTTRTLGELVAMCDIPENHRRTAHDDGHGNTWVRCAFDDGSVLTFTTRLEDDYRGWFDILTTLEEPTA